MERRPALATGSGGDALAVLCRPEVLGLRGERRARRAVEHGGPGTPFGRHVEQLPRDSTCLSKEDADSTSPSRTGVDCCRSLVALIRPWSSGPDDVVGEKGKAVSDGGCLGEMEGLVAG